MRKSSLRARQAAFADAVHALAAEPTGENVVRYLMASRNLDPAKDTARRGKAAPGPDRAAHRGGGQPELRRA